jgi:phytoene dehydrogenase-like protein
MNLMLLAWYHRFGATRVVGGTQGLADALLGAFESHGGRLRCAAPVQEILVDRGEACGVRLENGETLLARQGVLATPDPRMTLNTLLPSGSMDHRMERRAAHIAQYAVGVAPFMVHMAFSGQLTLDRFQRERKDDADLRVSTCFLGSFEGAYAGDIDAAAGRIPKEITVLCALPTAADPSQAPAGQDTAYVYACPMPLHPVEGWEVARPLAAQATVDRLTEYYEGIEELELGRWPESPADLAERMRVTNGCLWHVDLSPTRMGPLRPAAGLAGYRMPVPRLYHGGGGSHPNSSVSGMPGKLAAETLLRDMRRRPSHQPSAEFQHELSGAGDDRRPVAPLAAGPR